MCGIAGIIGNTKAYSIDRMLNLITHRGPDGCYVQQGDHWSFGHARLSIIDLTSKADQPMTDPESGNVIVFNGEIYNYLELKNEIGTRYHFRTASDTEVLLASYRVFGLNFLNKLRGMFSFALFDKSRGDVLMARDRFGIKPLYYREHNGSFLFSSEIKSLVNISGQNESINHQKAYEFLANSQLDTNEETMFKGIYQLTPAHYFRIAQNGMIREKIEYWKFPEPGHKKFDENAEQELVSRFNEVTALHMRSDVPVGTFLSGGIDSSCVTAFALRNLNTSALDTFSAVLPYHHPENALIPEMLSTDCRFRSHEFLLDGKDFFKDIPNLIFHHDEPTLDGSMYAHYKLCELSKAQNIKVLLSGSGGDELFGGYASHMHAQHAKLLRMMKWETYAKEIVQSTMHSGLSRSNIIFKSVYENLPQSLRRFIKNQQLKTRIHHVFLPGNEAQVKHYHHQHDDLFFSNLINNYKSWTAPPFLHYEDRNSMAFGVEIRVPFYDHLLVEFILQFDTLEIMKGRSKSMVRKSFKSFVPDKILNQKGKYGFPSPIDHALKTDSNGKAIFYSLAEKTPLLDTKMTKKLGEDFYNKKGSVSVFWRTLSFMIWYDIFFRNAGGYFNKTLSPVKTIESSL